MILLSILLGVWRITITILFLYLMIDMFHALLQLFRALLRALLQL